MAQSFLWYLCISGTIFLLFGYGQIYLLDKIPFDEITTEIINSTTNITIGWIKMISCTESVTSFTYNHTD